MPKDYTEESGNLSCSFCGKGQKEVRKLIAGPTVYICDECIELCNDIIEEDRVSCRRIGFYGAKLINKSVKTLQRWDRERRLIAQRNPSDRRYYTEKQLLEYKNIVM